MTRPIPRLPFLLALLPPGAVLVLHAVLGSYTRPLADDFCSLYYAERFGLLRSIWFWRLTWSGRYSAFAADWLETKFFGAYGLHLMPPLVLALWLVLIAAAVHAGLRSISPGGRQGPASILLGTVLLFTTLTLSPDIPQSLYWWNGMRSYALPLLLLALYAWWFLAWTGQTSAPSRPWLGGVAGFLLLFISGGLSETFAVAQFCLLIFLIGARVWLTPRRKPDAGLMLLLGGALGAAAALAVIISAPGNALRQLELPPSPDLGSLLVISSRGYARFLADLVLTPEKAAALLGALFAAAWLGSHYEQLPAAPARRIGLSLLGGFLLAFACFPPGVYGYSEPPPPRTQIIPVYLLSICLLYAAFLAGAHWRDRIDRARIRSGLTGIAIACLAFSAVVQAGLVYESRETYRDFARAWDAHDAHIRQAKAAGEASVTIPAVPNWARLNVLNDNPKFWVNECYSVYYGIAVFGSRPDPAE